MDTIPELEEMRRRIDEIDAALQRLITDRATVVQRIALLKKAYRASFHQPKREAEILKKIASRNQGPLSTEHLEKIFKEIFSVCLSLEKAQDEQTRTHLPRRELACS